MDTTHAQLCGCSDEACVWQDGRTWDVVRLDETLERVIIARYLDVRMEPAAKSKGPWPLSFSAA